MPKIRTHKGDRILIWERGEIVTSWTVGKRTVLEVVRGKGGK